jgi:hypothetical protein
VNFANIQPTKEKLTCAEVKLVPRLQIVTVGARRKRVSIVAMYPPNLAIAADGLFNEGTRYIRGYDRVRELDFPNECGKKLSKVILCKKVKNICPRHLIREQLDGVPKA